jgi:hypothetical protein
VREGSWKQESLNLLEGREKMGRRKKKTGKKRDAR